MLTVSELTLSKEAKIARLPINKIETTYVKPTIYMLYTSNTEEDVSGQKGS